MEREWRSTEPNPANAVLTPNEHRTAHGIRVGETHFTHRELREFGQWLIAQADEVEPAPVDTPKPAPTFKVGDRVRSAYDAQRVGTVVEVDMRSTWPYLVNWPGSSSNCRAEAIELADEKPEKPERRFHVFCLDSARTHAEARSSAEKLAKNSPGATITICEDIEFCKAVEKKTVEVEWS